uniref:Uncharacterized protein n=1 Tax=Octopus bimaculoides TaxID=37653 RepID=A0A0L8GVQ6_OCTBM
MASKHITKWAEVQNLNYIASLSSNNNCCFHGYMEFNTFYVEKKQEVMVFVLFSLQNGYKGCRLNEILLGSLSQ